jgi:aminoglycoside/choline kinase family phosphotransferase
MQSINDTKQERSLMDGIDFISEGYKELFGNSPQKISPLPVSGSDRRYFRIYDKPGTIIGAYNPNSEENEAFIGFTRHFISKNLPVPEIFGYLPQKQIYYLQDLGDTNFYTWFHSKLPDTGFNNGAGILFRKILDKLILFQTEGIDGLDLDLCYPHKSFDRQSMMWDMNYFKYMFLKLVSVPFNERHLEHDFNLLTDYLLEAGQNYFLYRDFQSANFMIIKDEPWFIDYQGGRKGAPQYDVASLLFDGKTPIPQFFRDELLGYYIKNFCAASGEDPEYFGKYYAGFSMIRLMQALGAFGFRGLYEHKPTFAETIVPAVGLLQHVIKSAEKHIALSELYNVVNAISDTYIFRKLEEGKHYLK